MISNARSKVCFQLAHEDAVQMVKGHPELVAEDFTALGQYQVYASLFTRGVVTAYASGVTLPPSAPTNDPQLIRRASRDRYGRPLDEIEAGFASLLSTEAQLSGDVGRRRRSP
jgi:hypothetical protein